MEEKYDQIEMDIGAIDNEEGNAQTPTQSVEAPHKTIKQANPETVQINDNYVVENEFDDDVELIVPDADVFERASDNEEKTSNMSEWTRGVIKRKNENDEIEYDDAFANSSRANSDFMKAFGISDKTGKAINLDESINPSTAEIETLQGDIHSDYYEYTDRQQRKEIIGMYKYAVRSIRTKIILASIFALFLFFIENISLFTSTPSGIFNIVAHPYLHFLLDFAALALCVLCAYEQLYHGIKSIKTKEFIPESILVFCIGMGLVYSVFTIIFIPFDVTPVLYNFPTAIMCVLTIIFSYLNVLRERYSFSVVSSRDSKFVLHKVETDDTDAETEAFSTASRDFVGDLIRVDKANFVRRYFAKTNQSISTAKIMYPYYLLVLSVPLIIAIISIFRGGSFMGAMSFWYAGVMLVMPVGILFMYSVPFLIGNKRLYEEETSIIGEETIYEYASAKAVSVNDTTAFPPYNVKLQGFNVYNDYKPEKVLYYAANGFSVVGGPLADVFEVATEDAFVKTKRAKFVCSGRSYLCVKVDNDTIIFADRYGISSNGIEIPHDREDAEEGACVMYMACNGKLCARMYINYIMDEEFAQTVRNLNKNGVSVGIRTFDPNLNNELLKLQTDFKKADLRVIRLTRDMDIPKTLEKTDSGIVSKGHSKSLIKAIPICKNIANARKAGTVVNVMASIIGVVLLCVSIFTSLFTLTPLIIVGYYVAWLLIMFIISSVMLLQ